MSLLSALRLNLASLSGVRGPWIAPTVSWTGAV